jgi:hypothetical protein
VRTAISAERPVSHELTQHVAVDLAQPELGGRKRTVGPGEEPETDGVRVGARVVARDRF